MRLLLNALGVVDFAVYNVILNVVMIASFLTISLNTIIQRYFSFAMGRKSKLSLQQVHNAGLQMSIIVVVISIVALETAGVWFVNNQLVIAPESFHAAQILFQFLILAFALLVFSTFYSSVIMAHEDMYAFAIISVLEAILRLVATVALVFFLGDQLIIYGVMYAIVAMIILLAFFTFSFRRYEECRLRKLSFEASVLQEMFAFGGWTIFGQITTVSRSQVLTILINQAFSPATVAARAISATVGAQILAFSKNFSSALHPPIIKAYANGETEQTFSLIYFGSKVTFFLVWMVTLPIISIAPGLLNFWLGSPPAETVLFTQLALVENAVVAISLPLMTAVRATGKVRLYELSLGTLQAFVLILSWIVIQSGAPAYFVYIVAIAINVLMFGLRLWLTHILVELPLGLYAKSVLAPVFSVVAASSGMAITIVKLVPEAASLSVSPLSLFAAAAIFILSPIVIFGLGLSRSERGTLRRTIQRKLSNSGSSK